MIRVSAFIQVGGYNSSLIAGEEPELCFRLRDNGWRIRRIDAEMTLHDAAMTKASQWWNRAKRSGYAYAQGYYLHGQSLELPLCITLLSLLDSLFLLLFILYPLQIFRLSIKNISHNMSIKNGAAYAVSNVCGKFPQFIGVLRFVKSHLQGRQSSLIEYK